MITFSEDFRFAKVLLQPLLKMKNSHFQKGLQICKVLLPPPPPPPQKIKSGQNFSQDIRLAKCCFSQPPLKMTVVIYSKDFRFAKCHFTPPPPPMRSVHFQSGLQIYKVLFYLHWKLKVVIFIQDFRCARCHFTLPWKWKVVIFS